jgi:hypothetical protein
VDPAGRDEEGVPGIEHHPTALLHHVPEEDIALLAGEGPVLEGLEQCSGSMTFCC